MLIDLDTGIDSRLESLKGDSTFRDAMSNLALGYREGKHVVTGPRRVLDQLMALEILDQRTRDTFRRIKARYQDGQNLLRRVSHFIRVGAAGEDDGAGREDWIAEEGGTQTCFRVPYRFFDDSSRIQTTCLLGEDNTDATFYYHATRAYVAHQKLGIEIRCILAGGGGSSTADLLRTNAAERPVLCIVDSDRDWPGAALGATARNALEIQDKLREGKQITKVLVLPCRTIENLFPGRLVTESLPDDADPGFRSRCERAREAGIFGGGEPFHHVHVKKGLSLCKSFTAQPRSKQDFLRELCTRLGPPANSSAWCQDACERESKPREPCQVFEGLGNTLLRHVTAYAGTQTPHKLAEQLFSKQQMDSGCGQTWADLGEVLLSWTCAFKPIRA